jgi:hypothetical protein
MRNLQSLLCAIYTKLKVPEIQSNGRRETQATQFVESEKIKIFLSLFSFCKITRKRNNNRNNNPNQRQAKFLLQTEMGNV